MCSCRPYTLILQSYEDKIIIYYNIVNMNAGIKLCSLHLNIYHCLRSNLALMISKRISFLLSCLSNTRVSCCPVVTQRTTLFLYLRITQTASSGNPSPFIFFTLCTLTNGSKIRIILTRSGPYIFYSL